MKHGIANKSVAFIEYVALMTTESVAVNLVQPGPILSKSHRFLGSAITNVGNLEIWRLEFNVPHQKLIKVLMMF